MGRTDFIGIIILAFVIGATLGFLVARMTFG
jgi:hypothetical protein